MEFHEFFHEVVIHSALDTLKLIPFLFVTYLLMEFIEHKSSAKTDAFIKKSGSLGPLVGGFLGIIPQCGFSSVASNLFNSGIITVGTTIAVFLSTSDEMIPILLASAIPVHTVISLISYKVVVAVLVGFTVDIIFNHILQLKPSCEIDKFCKDTDCHCEEEGILKSTIRHTTSITLFILLTTFTINVLLFILGKNTLAMLLYNKPVVSHIVASILGLVPNCATSVLLSTLYADGIITLGTMLSGLFTGAGAGLLVLYKLHPHKQTVLTFIGILVVTGIMFGIIADLPFISNLLC